jgi:hypothetical protein
MKRAALTHRSAQTLPAGFTSSLITSSTRKQEARMKSNADAPVFKSSREVALCESPLPDTDAPGRIWAPAERVVLDLDLPHLAIARALKRSDDAAIWREHARARDQEGFIHCLAQLAGRYVTQQTHFRDRSRVTDWHHVLIAVPFLVPVASWPVAAPASPDRAGAGTLLGVLQDWAGHEQFARMVFGCIRYVDLVRWSPVTQQDYLQFLAGDRKGVSPGPDTLSAHVPEGSVQLAFAIGSVRCWNTLPELPASALAAQWELRSRMAACLSYMNQCHVPTEHVLPPTPLADAVLAGLRLWLHKLADLHPFRRWDVRLGLKDVVYQELASDDEQCATIMLPMRRHQVGADGLAALTSDLARRFAAPACSDGLTAMARASIVH